MNKFDARFILLMTFFDAPVFISELFAQELSIRVVRHAASCLLYAVFIAAAISLVLFAIGRLNRFAEKFLKGGILAFCATIFLADAFALWYYGALINRTMLGIILATNPNEASEFISAYVLRGGFLALLLAIIVAFVLLSRLKLPRVSEKLLAAFLIVTVIIAGMRLVRTPAVVLEKGNPATRLAMIFPDVLESMKEYEELAGNANRQVVLTRNDGDLPLVVFILGESTTRNHMSLYGYDLPTTPNLDARNLNGELKIFSDTVSPHSHTMPVLQKLFSFYRRENETESANFWLSKGNFFDILNAAGYDTIWLSNQEASGIFGNIGRLYSETCTRRNFTRLRDSREENDAMFDESILPLFDADLKIASDKSFYVLHLMGTHSIYSRRYPATYEKFNPVDNTSASRTRAEYDNAVGYNDRIVDQIIGRVANLDAIVIYISDHGEDVYDDKEFAGHEESSPSRFMIEIPFIVWTSPKFRELHADVEGKIAAAVDKPFMTDDMIHLLMDMMKIATADFDATLSPLSADYNPDRLRIYGGRIYDKGRGLH